MSFLGIAFLFALPLAAAPLLLHLMDRRRNVVIDWGAMDFLLAASTRQTSARRLKQWALLLLRILAIGALILALARPLIPNGWLGTRDLEETILVIDNSMSTGRSNGDQTLMQSMLDRAGEELKTLSPGDRIRVLTTAPYPIWHRNDGSHGGGRRIDAAAIRGIQQDVQSIEPSQARSDLLAGLMTAIQADADPLMRRRRVVLLTDGQATDWRMEDTEGWNHFRNRLAHPVTPTELKVIQVAHDAASRGNVAVEEVHSRRTRVGVNEPIDLTATIRNHDTRSVAAARQVQWQVDGTTLFDGSLDSIEPGSSRESSWTHSFGTAGAYRITVTISGEDDLPADNEATLVIEVVEEVPVLIVESASQLADTQQDSFFVLAALGHLDEMGRLNEKSPAGRSVFVPTVVSVDRMASIELNSFHVVLLPNLTQLDRDTLESLSQFVVDGGGLWVALGPRTEVDEFNANWFANGGGISPVGLGRVVSESSSDPDSGPPITINPFGSDHPATKQISDHQQLDLGEVVVNRRFQFLMQPGDDQSRVLLTLSTGAPIVVERLLGRGRVIVQSIPLRMQWSDLARSQAFVVMVRDWMDYLAHPRSTQFNLRPGDPIVYHVGKEEGSPTGMLTTPQKESIELVADGFGDAVLRTTRTSLPGTYQLETGLAGETIPFQVIRDPRESNLSPLSDHEQKELSDLAGIQSTAGDTAVASSRPSDPLWPYLLVGLITLITLELLLSGMMARDRMGVTGMSEKGSSAESDFVIPETSFPLTGDSQPGQQGLSPIDSGKDPVRVPQPSEVTA